MSTYIYQEKLESDRLNTRWLNENDIVKWADFFSDKEAIEFLPVLEHLSNFERSKQWIEKQLNRHATHQFGLQALIDKQSNSFIGQCGLLAQDIDGNHELEVGYHIFKKYWGQGFAPEAAKLFIDYAFQNHLSDSVISIIDTKNFKSQKVADKNGLIKEKEISWSGHQVYIYRIYSDA